MNEFRKLFPAQGKLVKFKKILANRLAYLQTFFVLMAFALMVFFSYWYVSGIENKHLVRNAENVFQNTWIKMEADLQEPKSNLVGFSQTVRNMIIGGKADMMQHYFTDISNIFVNEDVLKGFDGIYAYFYDYGDIDGWQRTLPEGYDAKTRPWYATALNANGKIATTQPYINVRSGMMVVTYSILIFNEENKPLGVIALSVKLDRIGGYAVNTYIYDGSYGILFDSSFNVIAHPNAVYLGKHIDLMNDGESIRKELEKNKKILGGKAIDYFGRKAVLFFQQFPNGWYMAVLTPEDKHNENLVNMMKALLALGLLFAIALSIILLRVISARIKSDELVQTILDTTPLVVNLWNKKYQNTDTNEEGMRLFNLSSKAEYLDRFGELSPEYQPDGRLSSDKAIEVLNIAFEEGRYRFEWMHQKLNGELVPCEVTLIRINYRDDFMVVGYTRDLREVKAAMEKMREADERARILLNSVPMSATLFDSKSDIIDCNEAALNLLGLTKKEDYTGSELFKYSPPCQPDGTPSLQKALYVNKKALDEGIFNFEWMHLDVNGEEVPCEVTLVRVKLKGEIVVAGYARDLREQQAMIREIRKAEIAEASNRAKTKFLATMSHEIRTPMNAILGIAEIQLQDDTLTPPVKEAFGEIYNSGELLIGIINDILDLSKIDADKMELKLTKYDVASLINDAVHLNMMRNSKPVEFKLEVDENVPIELHGDELRIKQILNNLLSNAYKYTEEGSIKLLVHAEKENVEDGYVNIVFRINDTGQGMTSEQKEALFTSEYSRYNLEANRTIQGTGLGMNIVWRLTKIMNGEILVESKPSEGTSVTVRLPQKVISSKVMGKELVENLQNFRVVGSPSSRVKKAQIIREYMPYGKVLIVDDVESNLHVAKGLMAPYGLSIDVVTSGFAAIDKIKQGIIYDIIFMDHMMPKLDGMETTKVIRDLGYTEPIVALTANAVIGQSKIFLDNGFDEFISKPIDTRQLNSVLNKFIRNKQTPEILAEARKQKQSMEETAFKGEDVQKTDQILKGVFLLDVKNSLPVLEDTLKNIDAANAEDLHQFTISAHSMKSALANIGEAISSKLAFALEKAGRENNRKAIKMQAPVLIDDIRSIKERIEAESKKGSKAKTDANENLEFLREQLKIIHEACSNYDERPIKSALSALKELSWSKENGELIGKIDEQLLYGDFEEVKKLAEGGEAT